MVDSQSSTSPDVIRVIVDPNWGPAEKYITGITVSSPYGTQVYSDNNLEINKNSSGYFHIGGGPGVSPLQFSADLVDENTCSITVNWSNSDVDNISSTLAYDDGTGGGPERYVLTNSGQGYLDHVWFMPQGQSGSHYYDIDLWVRGEN